jgi:hypothetical protein
LSVSRRPITQLSFTYKAVWWARVRGVAGLLYVSIWNGAPLLKMRRYSPADPRE